MSALAGSAPPDPASRTSSGSCGAWWDRRRWYGRWTVYLLLIVGALLLPAPAIGQFMTPETDWPSVLFYPIGIYVLLAIGLNVVVGQAGLLDLGYVAFFAIGAYTMAVFGTKHGWDFWVVLPAGIIICAAVRAHPGHADPAIARRLPGHRHARVRRDHPDHREQPGLHRRPARHLADPAPAVQPLVRDLRSSPRSGTA